MGIDADLVVARPAETGRLLRSPLAAPLLGETLPLDLFAQNGFRFLGVPAWLDRAALSSRAQRFRNTWRVDAALARLHAIRTISDNHLDPDVPLQAVSRLDNPRHRFIAELFWVHVAEPDFADILNAGDLGSAAIARIFDGGGRDPLDQVLRTHVVALSRHCQAIEAELDFLDHRADPPAGQWERALDSWRAVWQSDVFWAYLRQRVATLDDPRLLDQDVDRARAELPSVLLGLHEALAERYAALENYMDCARHLNLIRGSAFSADHIRAATATAVKKVAGTRLEDLQRRVKQATTEMKGAASRATFDRAVAPLLQEAQEIRLLLAEQLELPDEFLEVSAFDRLADLIQQAANKKINYADEERERNILYCSTISRRLLTLPLSGGARRIIEQSILSDSRILYTPIGMEGPTYPEALKCFFVDGADADPDASLVIRMYRITTREVQVNQARGSAGVRVAWRAVRLLVPRSKIAAQHAGAGAVTIEAAEADYTPAQRKTAARLKQKEHEHRDARQAIRDAGEDSAREEAEQSRAAIASAKERGGAALADAQHALAKESQAEATRVAAEKQRLDTEQHAIRARYEPAVKAARALAKKQTSRLSGVTGFASIDVPFAAVATLAFWLASRDISGAALGGVLAGVVLGRLLRLIVSSSIARTAAGPERVRDAALKSAALASAKKEQEIHDASEKRGRPWKKAVEAFDVEVARLDAAGRKKVEGIHKAINEQCQKADRAFEQRVASMRAELVRTVQARKESQKTEFPAYRAAKSKGFKEGTEASASEMEMTQSERTEALLRLRIGI
jgi:hypothetical protein